MLSQFHFLAFSSLISYVCSAVSKQQLKILYSRSLSLFLHAKTFYNIGKITPFSPFSISKAVCAFFKVQFKINSTVTFHFCEHFPSKKKCRNQRKCNLKKKKTFVRKRLFFFILFYIHINVTFKVTRTGVRLVEKGGRRSLVGIRQVIDDFFYSLLLQILFAFVYTCRSLLKVSKKCSAYLGY